MTSSPISNTLLVTYWLSVITQRETAINDHAKDIPNDPVVDWATGLLAADTRFIPMWDDIFHPHDIFTLGWKYRYVVFTHTHTRTPVIYSPLAQVMKICFSHMLSKTLNKIMWFYIRNFFVTSMAFQRCLLISNWVSKQCHDLFTRNTKFQHQRGYLTRMQSLLSTSFMGWICK